jgi:hypothetical protein
MLADEESILEFNTTNTNVFGGKIDPIEQKQDDLSSLFEIAPTSNANIGFREIAVATGHRIASICDIELTTYIEVTDPKMQTAGLADKHIVYTIRGKDELSSFEQERRYKEFVALRRRLNE